MLLHQPGERRAMLMKMRLLYPPRFLGGAIEQALDVRAHPLIDQRKQAGRSGIEAIVEVEDPVSNVLEAGVHALDSGRQFNRLSKLKGSDNHVSDGEAVHFQRLERS